MPSEPQHGELQSLSDTQTESARRIQGQSLLPLAQQVEVNLAKND